jgi:hypothetical protein
MQKHTYNETNNSKNKPTIEHAGKYDNDWHGF